MALVLSGGPPPQPWYSLLLTPISLAINILLGLIAITQLTRKSRQRLEARVIRHDFRIPFGDTEMSSENEQIRNVLQKMAWIGRLSFFQIHIHNLSKKKAVGVRVNIPDRAIVAQIERNTVVERIFPEGNQILIGDLQPRDEVTVRTWSRSGYNPVEVEEVRVSHEEGVARLKPQYLIGRFWYRLANFVEMFGIPMFLTILILVAFGLLLSYALSVTSTPRPGASPTPTPLQASPTSH